MNLTKAVIHCSHASASNKGQVVSVWRKYSISLLKQLCSSGTKDDGPSVNIILLCAVFGTTSSVGVWTELDWLSDSFIQNGILMLVIMKANSRLGQNTTQSSNSYQTVRRQVTEAIFFKAINIWVPEMVRNFVTSETNTSFIVTLLNRFVQLANSSKPPVQSKQAYHTIHQDARFLVRTRDFSLTNRENRLWSPPSNFNGFR